MATNYKTTDADYVRKGEFTSETSDDGMQDFADHFDWMMDKMGDLEGYGSKFKFKFIMILTEEDE